MGYLRPFTAGTNTLPKTFTQLTATGVTSSEVVQGLKNHSFVVTLDNVNTDVDFQFEGSVDGTIFVAMQIETTAVTGYTLTETLVTATVDGDYEFFFKNRVLDKIRFNFVAENGGSAATLEDIAESSRARLEIAKAEAERRGELVETGILD